MLPEWRRCVRLWRHSRSVWSLILSCPLPCSPLLAPGVPPCPILPSLLSSLLLLSLLPRLLPLSRVWDAWVYCCVRERIVTMPLSPTASITNGHKLGGLEQRAFVLLQFWRSEVWRQFPGLELRSLIWGQNSLWRPCLLWFWHFIPCILWPKSPSLPSQSDSSILESLSAEAMTVSSLACLSSPSASLWTILTTCRAHLDNPGYPHLTSSCLHIK